MDYRICEACQTNLVEGYGETLCKTCKKEKILAQKKNYKEFAKNSDITRYVIKNGEPRLSTKKATPKPLKSNKAKPKKKKGKKDFVPYNNIAHPYQGGGCSGK